MDTSSDEIPDQIKSNNDALGGKEAALKVMELANSLKKQKPSNKVQQNVLLLLE